MANVTMFDRPYPAEKQAEGIAVMSSIMSGECNRCPSLAECSTNDHFRFPEDALGIGKAKREAFDEPAYADGWNSAIAIIEQAPTVDAVEVVHGRWIEKPYLFGTTRYCSICGNNYGMPHGIFNYCPNCGAKMDGGNGE